MARADWLTALGKNEVTSQMFRNYSDRLLAESDKTAPTPVDCGMLVLGRTGDCDASAHQRTRDELAVETLTAFTNDGFGTTGLPTCMEDSVCVHCMDVLKGLPE